MHNVINDQLFLKRLQGQIENGNFRVFFAYRNLHIFGCSLVSGKRENMNDWYQ
jgi:hypothetical protein